MKIKNTGQVVDIKDAKKLKGFTGSQSQWENEVKGRGLQGRAKQYIASLPHVETKSSQNEDILSELKEGNDAIARSHCLPNSDLMKQNEEQRKGKPIHYLTFLKKLRKAGIHCWYNEKPWEGIIGLRAVRKGYEQLGAQFVCGVKQGWTWEYDLFNYDAHGVELNKKFIGWRTVLISLIGKGILTEKEAHEIFGKPQICDATAPYRSALCDIRNYR